MICKYLFVLGIVLLYGFPILAQNNEIIWDKDFQLVWSDFTGRWTGDKEISAISCVVLDAKYRFDKERISIEVYSKFLPKKSWKKNDTLSVKLLAHERGHFDIVEIYARKLRQQLSEMKLNPKNIEKKFYKALDAIVKEKDKRQARYDQETELSRNEEKQKEWEKQIALELEELAAFANPVIEVRIK